MINFGYFRPCFYRDHRSIARSSTARSSIARSSIARSKAVICSWRQQSLQEQLHGACLIVASQKRGSFMGGVSHKRLLDESR